MTIPAPVLMGAVAASPNAALSTACDAPAGGTFIVAAACAAASLTSCTGIGATPSSAGEHVAGSVKSRTYYNPVADDTPAGSALAVGYEGEGQGVTAKAAFTALHIPGFSAALDSETFAEGTGNAPSVTTPSLSAGETLLIAQLSYVAGLTVIEAAGWTTHAEPHVGLLHQHVATRIVTGPGPFTYAPGLSGSTHWGVNLTALRAA